jgi:hypothetical protein
MGLIETVAEMAVPQVGLPLRLLSGVRGAATWLVAHPMTAIALVAGVFGAVEHHEAAKWAALARQRATTLAAIQAANASAIQQATAAKEAKDAYNAKLAAQSDQTAADLRGRYHAAVLQLAAAQSRARGADLPGDASAAQGSDGPGQGAGVPVGAGAGEPADPLAISQDDALTCADNTARLQAVHDWAVGLGQ